MKQAVHNIKNALTHIMTAGHGETILILYDDMKEDLGSLFMEASESASLYARAQTIVASQG